MRNYLIFKKLQMWMKRWWFWDAISQLIKKLISYDYYLFILMMQLIS